MCLFKTDSLKSLSCSLLFWDLLFRTKFCIASKSRSNPVMSFVPVVIPLKNLRDFAASSTLRFLSNVCGVSGIKHMMIPNKMGADIITMGTVLYDSKSPTMYITRIPEFPKKAKHDPKIPRILKINTLNKCVLLIWNCFKLITCYRKYLLWKVETLPWYHLPLPQPEIVQCIGDIPMSQSTQSPKSSENRVK